ncbi:MAG: RHS repeat-associated core domain-containing protein [Taibaiella sp.]|nr:RHS repeat-associated core domain-containing protein [Taibaiella sp.]
MGTSAGRIAMLEKRSIGTDDSLPTLTRYVNSNHLQSASLELDGAANIISYEEYHPYGTTAFQAKNASINAVAKRYRYTGKERDEESGLYYHGARYYIPWLCRWTASDPLENEYAGWSPYHYVKCNPVMDTDSTGMGGDKDDATQSKGTVTVSFYPGGAVRGKDPDAVGADQMTLTTTGFVPNKPNGKDDWIEAITQVNQKTSNTNPSFKSMGITDIKQIGIYLNKLKEEGYTIGNIIISAHSSTASQFWLGGRHDFSKSFIDKVYAKQLQPYLSPNSKVVLNMCNFGAGENPQDAQNMIDYFSKAINAPVFASMTFGSGNPDAFNLKNSGVIMNTTLNMSEYLPGGGHNVNSYKPNSVKYEKMYYSTSPTSTPLSREAYEQQFNTIARKDANIPNGRPVLNLSVSHTGKITFDSSAQALKKQFQLNSQKMIKIRSLEYTPTWIKPYIIK